MESSIIPVGEVKFVSGNVLDADADIICHQVNCMGKMGSGIALQVRNRFGYVYEEYKALCERCEPGEMIGTVLFSERREEDGGGYIANIFGQIAFGYDGAQYTIVEALENGIGTVFEFANKIAQENARPAKVAFPARIGCVRGGANWDDVLKDIKKNAEENEMVQVTIYDLNIG